MTGWECPRCHWCYSPLVSYCGNCNRPEGVDPAILATANSEAIEFETKKAVSVKPASVKFTGTFNGEHVTNPLGGVQCGCGVCVPVQGTTTNPPHNPKFEVR